MKHKVALVTYGFTGSTFPLAKALLNRGCQVDIYLLNYNKIEELEAFDCEYEPHRYGVEEIPQKEWYNMYLYLDTIETVRLFSLKFPRPFLTVPVLRSIVSCYTTIFDAKVARFMNRQCYDVVNFIGAYFSQNYLSIIKRLNCKVVFSLHEVCNHSAPDYLHPTALLNYLIKTQKDLIVYSDNSYRCLLNYSGLNVSKVKRLNFGLFNSYTTLHPSHKFSLPMDYILYFGNILPYKGLSILYEAFKKIENPDVKLVVAGKGDDPCLHDLKNDKRCIVINKRICNQEVCELIKGCLFVVCPYISMSQSGLPQTVYTFNKPIIASDLDGFKEVISHDENGMLFKTGDAEALSHCMKTLLNNTAMYQKMAQKVSEFETTHRTFSWDYIAQEFESCFLRQ